METITACLGTTLLKGLKFVFDRTSGAHTSRVRGFWRACMMSAGLVSSAHALQLTIAWDINSVGELGFNIERSQDGTNFVQIATVAAGVSSYTDLNVATGTYWYRVRAFNSSTYSSYSNVASNQTAVSAPSFTTQPASQSVAAGANVSFSAVAAGSPVPALQWKKNGVAISGATGASLTLNNVSSDDAASYTAVATNSAGTVTSIAAVLTLTSVTPVSPPPVNVAPPSQLQNVSARAMPGKGGQVLAMNFTVKGAETSMLVRAIGPGLDAFTSVATFSDPKLALLAAGTTIASNDNWGGSATLASVFTQVGAFPLSPNSKDAAIFGPLTANTYSAAISGKSGGLAMIEVYDSATADGRISKVEVSAPVGSGEERLIAGFTISGSAPLRVLIRAIGLGQSGRKSSGLDPSLDIHRGAALVQRNDNWGGTAALKSSFVLAGASSLAPDSSDAAVDVTLEPGTYTATVSGVSNSTGSAQLEIYEIQ